MFRNSVNCFVLGEEGRVTVPCVAEIMHMTLVEV